jgi:hypothetical protein
LVLADLVEPTPGSLAALGDVLMAELAIANKLPVKIILKNTSPC